MKKNIVIFFILTFFLASIFTFASAPPPSPKCEIKGIIQSVEFVDAYNASCLTEEGGCPTDTELIHPARYFFNIKINTVSYMSGETSYITCEELLPLNTYTSIFINKDKVNAEDFFEPGQKINGQVSSFWGISFDSYELEQNTNKDTKIEVEDSDTQITSYILFGIIIISIFTVLLIYYFKKKN